MIRFPGGDGCPVGAGAHGPEWQVVGQFSNALWWPSRCTARKLRRSRAIPSSPTPGARAARHPPATAGPRAVARSNFRG